MMKYIKYFWYIIKHKWFVMLECWKEGLYWRGLIHDISKFRPSEFFPYANHFCGNIKKGRDKTGYYKPTDTGDPAFDKAWFLHQKRNDHHWQWWVMPDEAINPKMPEKDTDLGPIYQCPLCEEIFPYWPCNNDDIQKVKVFPMSKRARLEMLCDWIGAGRAQGTPDTLAWWSKNNEKMILDKTTKDWVLEQIKIVDRSRK